MKMKPKTKTPATVKREQRLQRLEDVAYAAYQMETGTYPYPKGVPRGHKKPDGTHDWNKNELLRLFGWEHSGRSEAITEDPHFLRTLEWHRWRGSDPTFRKRIRNETSCRTMELIMDANYEQMLKRPESVSISGRMRIFDSYVKAGVQIEKQKMKDKTDELLGECDEKDREALFAEQRKDLQRQLRDLDSKEQAIEGALEES